MNSIMYEKYMYLIFEMLIPILFKINSEQPNKT